MKIARAKKIIHSDCIISKNRVINFDYCYWSSTLHGIRKSKHICSDLLQNVVLQMGVK